MSEVERFYDDVSIEYDTVKSRLMVKNSQKGFVDNIYVVIFFLAVLLAVFIFDSIRTSNERSHGREKMEDLGYTLIVSYGGNHKYLPDTSPCVNEEFKLVDSRYRVVSSLADAKGAICKLK